MHNQEHVIVLAELESLANKLNQARILLSDESLSDTSKKRLVANIRDAESIFPLIQSLDLRHKWLNETFDAIAALKQEHN